MTSAPAAPPPAPFQSDPANRDQWQMTTRLPFADPVETLWRPRHLLQGRLVNRPQRKVIGLGGQRLRQFCGDCGY